MGARQGGSSFDLFKAGQANKEEKTVNQHLRSLCVLTVATLTLAGGQVAYGQNNRSWVANNGSDANPCTQSQPCLTLQRAHNNTNAGGEIDALNQGDYGAVTITKAITIDGGTFASIQVTSNSTTGVLVAAGTSDTVVLRNLSITALPTAVSVAGIAFVSGKSLYVEKVALSNFGALTSTFSAFAISVDTSAFSETFIQDTVVQNCEQGVSSLPQSSSIAAISIDNVKMEGGLWGFFGSDGTRATIRNSVIAAQTQAGVEVDGASLGAEANVQNTSVLYSATALRAASGGTIRASRNTIANNENGFGLNGGTIVSFGNNEVTGNRIDGTPSSTISLK